MARVTLLPGGLVADPSTGGEYLIPGAGVVSIEGTPPAEESGGGFWLPDSRLMAPALLEPGRKPTTPVEIDLEHPLARELDFFVIPGAGTDISPKGAGDIGIAYDIARNAFATQRGSSGGFVYEPRSTVGITASVLNRNWSIYWGNLSGYSGTGTDVTLYTVFNMTIAQPDNALLVATQDSQVSNTGYALALSASAGQLQVVKGGVAVITSGLTPSVGSNYFAGVSYTHSTGKHTFILRNMDTGVTLTSDKTNTSSWAASNGAYAFCQTPQGQAMAGMNLYAMSRAELLSLAHNPYQFLRPKLC